MTYLSFIGGEDEKDTICRAMGAVIGNDCAKLYNWYGKKVRRNSQIYNWPKLFIVSDASFFFWSIGFLICVKNILKIYIIF